MFLNLAFGQIGETKIKTKTTVSLWFTISLFFFYKNINYFQTPVYILLYPHNRHNFRCCRRYACTVKLVLATPSI